jgi:hypothetical protein
MKSSLQSLIPFLPPSSTTIPGDTLNSHLTAHLELRKSNTYSQLNYSLLPLCTDGAENTVCNNTSIVACLPIGCLETGSSGFRSSYHVAPSLRLFVPNGLKAYGHLLLSEGCACDVCAWFHLPSRGSVFLRCLLCSRFYCSFLKASRPERLPNKLSVDPGLSPSSRALVFPVPTLVCSLFFRFGGDRLFHNVQSLIFESWCKIRLFASRSPPDGFPADPAGSHLSS